MDDLKKMIACEIAVERRLEKSCERDGWVASAHVAFGWDYVDCGDGLQCVRGSPPFVAANILPDCEGKEGSGMKLLHHSHSTNGVRPSAPSWNCAGADSVYCCRWAECAVSRRSRTTLGPRAKGCRTWQG